MKQNKIIIIAVLALAVISAGALGLWLGQEKQEQPPVQTAEAPPKTEPVQPPESAMPVPEKKKEAPRLRFGPKHGQSIAYRFESGSDAVIDFSLLMPAGMPGAKTPQPSAQSSKTAVRLKASGELRLKYYDLEPGIWNVAAALSDVEYRLNDRTPAYSEGTTYPFVFRMKSSGFLSDFQFTQGIPGEARQFFRTFYTPCRPRFPKNRNLSGKPGKLT